MLYRFYRFFCCDSFEKFKEGFPSKDKFYDSLTNCAVSGKNYEHVLNVWKDFNVNTIKDYNDLYLKVDVLLLVCVFETGRKESINYFELALAHYLSTPGYSWDAMLRFTDVNLKLASDIEKYLFVESTIRGDISMICKGCAEAKSKFWKSYDASKAASCIIYLDGNNLYGPSLMQHLPTEILVFELIQKILI